MTRIRETWIINKSGFYCLKEDFVWRPISDTNDTAIIISADHVTLDLGGFSIINTCNDNKPIDIDTIGLRVIPSPGPPGKRIQDVTIRNGKIKNFSLQGLSAINCSILNLSKLKCHCIGNKTSPIFIFRSGFDLSGCAQINIENCQASKVVSGAGKAVGFLLFRSSQALLKECTANTIINVNGESSGFEYNLSSDNVATINCKATKIKTGPSDPSLLPLVNTSAGFSTISSTSFLFDNCQVSNVKSVTDDADGFKIFDSGESGIILNCSVKKIVSGTMNGRGSKANGYEILSSNNVIVKNSVARYIFAYNPFLKQCVGFSNGLCTNISFIDCISRNIKIFTKLCTFDSFSFGFGYTFSPRLVGPSINTRFLNCVAECSDVGIGLFNHIGAQVTKCLVKKCKLGIFTGFKQIVIGTFTLVNEENSNLVQDNKFACVITIISDPLKPNDNNTYKKNKKISCK